ncbi:MAG: sugar phosphate isomerase/epimerase [Bacteroidales bacterium]|nr:sugar phosphate isomerase/epimerase [Bacteroidales bacterium]
MMKNIKSPENTISRRKFIGGTAAAAAITMVPFAVSCNGGTTAAPAVSDKPDSNFGGVQIGAITYSWRSMPGGVENIIKYCKEAGLSSIELMSGDLETYLGAPQNPMTAIMAAQRQQAAAAPPPPPPPPPPAGARPAGQGAAPAGGQGGGFQRRQMTPEQEAAVAKYNQDLKEWRVSVPEAKILEARKLFNDAGINIPIVKFSPGRWSDEEIDYAFRTAKAMGAKGVTDEIGEDAVNKLGPIAAKHGMYAIFHNHMQFATPGFSYDPFLAVSPAVMMNFDVGHFFGSTGIHPNTILEKYHDRIFSIHIKDKTGPDTVPPNTNQVWGQGEVPLAEILLLIKKNKWPIYCDIELEYEVKPWSNAVKETGICVNYARQILI